MTDTIHIWVPHHEVDARLAEGWIVSPGWQNAAHHLRYSLPMYREIDEPPPQDDGTA